MNRAWNIVPAVRQEPDVVARQLDRLALEGLREHPEVRKVLGREESGAGTSASYV